MIKILLIMLAGIAVGVIIRKAKMLISVSNKSIIWVIFLLLFFMGISVGKNPDIMNNLTTIGLRGLQLALVAILGSVVLSWIVYKAFFKNGTNNIKNSGINHER